MAKPRKPSTSAGKPSRLSQNKTGDATETPEVGKDTPDASPVSQPVDAVEDAVLIEEEDGKTPEEESLWPSDDDTGQDTLPASVADQTVSDRPDNTDAENRSTEEAAAATAMPAPVLKGSDANDNQRTTADSASAAEDRPAASEGGASGFPTTSRTSRSDANAAHVSPREKPAIRKGPGFLTMLLGGVAAGAIGYYVAEYAPFAAQDDTSAVIEQQSAQIADQAARLDELEAAVAAASDPDASNAISETVVALETQIAELQAALAGLEPSGSGLSAEDLEAFRASSQDEVSSIQARLEEMSQNSQTTFGDISSRFEAQIAELTTSLGALTQQVEQQDLPSAEDLAALEAKIAELNEQVTPLNDRITELNAQIAAQDEQIAQAEAAAEAETRRISGQAALSQIAAAIENGTPYQDAIGALQGTVDAEVPPALAEPAPTGVATLATLQTEFPDYARDGLDAAIGATAGDGPLNRFGAFIKSQTGARALSEREGSDPDAILSRAEARLREGDLSAALAELENLPDEGQAAISDWTDRAEARLAARAALDELSATLTSN